MSCGNRQQRVEPLYSIEYRHYLSFTINQPLVLPEFKRALSKPWSPISKSRRKVPLMSCCDALAAECPLDLTEDDCRTLIRLLRHLITPDWEPQLPRLEPLRVILDKLEFAVGR